MTIEQAPSVLDSEYGVSTTGENLEQVVSEPFDPDKTTMFTTPSTTPPGPGWWLADDGEWYPPETPPASKSPGPGYWMASDGRWYPPGQDATTTIEPVPAPNAFASWQPEPQPHDQIAGEGRTPRTTQSSRPPSADDVRSKSASESTPQAAAASRAELDLGPTWIKVVAVLLVLAFVAAIALTALDITL